MFQMFQVRTNLVDALMVVAVFVVLVVFVGDKQQLFDLRSVFVSLRILLLSLRFPRIAQLQHELSNKARDVRKGVVSPVEQVVNILKGFKARLPGMDMVTKDEIDYVVHVVSTNALHRTRLFANGAKAQPDKETEKWLIKNFSNEAETLDKTAENEGASGAVKADVSPEKLDRRKSKVRRHTMLSVPKRKGSRSNPLFLPEQLQQHASKNSNEAQEALYQSMPDCFSKISKERLTQVNDDMDTWTFDVFELDALSQGKSLLMAAVTLFRKYDLVEKFDLDEAVMNTFFTRINEGYVQKNPYHNHMHATDVMIVSSFF
jgi:hypothetical protein